jgi:hypothetical protein
MGLKLEMTGLLYFLSAVDVDELEVCSGAVALTLRNPICRPFKGWRHAADMSLVEATNKVFVNTT